MAILAPIYAMSIESHIYNDGHIHFLKRITAACSIDDIWRMGLLLVFSVLTSMSIHYLVLKFKSRI
jgi:hypothetical protein